MGSLNEIPLVYLAGKVLLVLLRGACSRFGGGAVLSLVRFTFPSSHRERVSKFSCFATILAHTTTDWPARAFDDPEMLAFSLLIRCLLKYYYHVATLQS